MTRAACRVAAALSLAQVGAAAAADDCAPPCFGYEISAELQNDWTFAAEPSAATANVLAPSVTAGVLVLPAPGVGLIASVTTEPVEDPAFGENAFFDSVGAYVEELYTFTEIESVTLRLGKFDPVFSLAGEVLPGIASTELADEIDASERLGAEADIGFAAFGLNHRLAAAAFTTDRSVLGGSFFVSRERTSLEDGGAGNTHGLSSLSAVLTGCAGVEAWACYEEGAFGYHIGFRFQKTDMVSEAATGHERAYLAAATRSVALGDMTLVLLAETAYLASFEGGDDDALFLTGSAALEVEPLIYVATFSQQRDFVADERDAHQHLMDVEALYVAETDLPFPGSDWEFGAAYSYARTSDDEERHILSLRLTLDFVGAFGSGPSSDDD